MRSSVHLLAVLSAAAFRLQPQAGAQPAAALAATPRRYNTRAGGALDQRPAPSARTGSHFVRAQPQPPPTTTTRPHLKSTSLFWRPDAL